MLSSVFLSLPRQLQQCATHSCIFKEKIDLQATLLSCMAKCMKHGAVERDVGKYLAGQGISLFLDHFGIMPSASLLMGNNVTLRLACERFA